MDGIFFVLRTGTPWRDLPGAPRPLHDLLQPLQPVEQERPLGEDNVETSGTCGRRRQRRRRRQRGASPAHGGFLVDPRPQARRGRPTGRRASRGRVEPRRQDHEVHIGIDGNALVKVVLLTPGQGGRLHAGWARSSRGSAGRDGDRRQGLRQQRHPRHDFDGRSDRGHSAESSRNEQRELDREAYRERNLVERFIAGPGSSGELQRGTTRPRATSLSTVRLAISRFLLRRVAGRLIESTA